MLKTLFGLYFICFTFSYFGSYYAFRKIAHSLTPVDSQLADKVNNMINKVEFASTMLCISSIPVINMFFAFMCFVITCMSLDAVRFNASVSPGKDALVDLVESFED